MIMLNADKMQASIVRVASHDVVSKANPVMKTPTSRMINVNKHLNSVFIVSFILLL